jgi:hypothetical protein
MDDRICTRDDSRSPVRQPEDTVNPTGNVNDSNGAVDHLRFSIDDVRQRPSMCWSRMVTPTKRSNGTYRNSGILDEGAISPFVGFFPDGFATDWYESGEPRRLLDYANGVPHGARGDVGSKRARPLARRVSARRPEVGEHVADLRVGDT